MAQAIKKAFSLGKLSSYSQGGGVPNGEYQLNFSVVMRKAEKGPPISRPVIQINFKPLKGGDPIEWSYGLGTDMEKSWAPNAEGTGLTPIPAGPGDNPRASANWGIFLKEMYNAGLPENYFDNDLSVLNPCNVFIKSIPPPAERASFKRKANSAEGGGTEEEQRDSNIAVVSAFLDGGKPWEGEVAEIKSKAPVKPNGKAGKATVAVPVAADSEVDPETALNEALGTVLGASPEGCSKVQLNQKVHAHITENYSEELAQMITTDVMSVPAELAAVLKGVGFKVAGFKVVPITT